MRVITDNLHEDQYTFFIVSRTFLLRIRNISKKYSKENQITPFILNDVLENRAVYEIILKTFVESGRPQIIWRMRIACWIPKSTNIRSEYVIFSDFPLHHQSH